MSQHNGHAPRVPSLDKIFKPNNVAVIGATEKEGSVGRTIIKNLITNPFGGTIFPVNPKRPNVLGIQTYPSIGAIPADIDLAVIVTPAPTVPAVIDECIAKGVEGAIIISAGFKEVGASGVELERQILEKAKGKMRIIGPNCLGVMLPFYGMNATFAGSMARPGNVAFISQSGAICTAVLDWSFQANVGFSSFISIGSMLDINWGDLIYYLGNDPHTQSIVIYMETVGNARAFISAAREVGLKKPIIVIKAGRTAAAAQAAASHTGSLAGSDDVLDAAFRRSGVLRVESISDVFDMAEVLAKQPRPKGNRLTIVTNAGGPGVLATDTLILGGGELSDISEETVKTLNGFLPSAWSHGNPIDILGDAEPARYAKALEIAAEDPNSDGLLVILTPQDMTDPTRTAEALKPYAQIEGKPVIASWMGGANVEAGERILDRAGIPTFAYPDAAVRAFNYMWKYAYNQRGLYETPAPVMNEGDEPDRALVAQIFAQVRSEGRTILTESESKAVLGAYRIPITPMKIAATADEAAAAADAMGYPVVVKLNSQTITHKADVGGVQLNLKNAQQVRDAYARIEDNVRTLKGAEHFQGVSVQPMVKLGDGYELIVGSSIDPQFGPVLLFGTGGTLVEVFRDSALALPPLNTTLAQRMMEQTKIYHALHGVRGRKPVDLNELQKILVRFSEFIVEQPWIAECDINPLVASPDGIIALDGRVVLHPSTMDERHLPKPAIRPYPVEYVDQWTSEEAIDFTIRPIRPEDEPLLVDFHGTLSERTVMLRFFQPMSYKERVAHERLSRIAFIDYDREMALVACRNNPKTHEPEIAAVGRLTKFQDRPEAEFSIIVSDKFQGQGLGKELLTRLMDIGRREGVYAISGQILSENASMLNIVTQLGFAVKQGTNGINIATLML